LVLQILFSGFSGVHLVTNLQSPGWLKLSTDCCRKYF
jgi:hypothetical protein